MTRTKGILLLLLVFAASAGFGAWGVVTLLDQIQQGRTAGVKVTCAVLSGISEAGRQTITGPPTPPPAGQERALERLGFPPFKERHKEAQAAAAAYVDRIAQRVEAAVGRKGVRLVRKDGTIDCQAFHSLTKAPG